MNQFLPEKAFSAAGGTVLLLLTRLEIRCARQNGRSRVLWVTVARTGLFSAAFYHAGSWALLAFFGL